VTPRDTVLIVSLVHKEVPLLFMKYTLQLEMPKQSPHNASQLSSELSFTKQVSLRALIHTRNGVKMVALNICLVLDVSTWKVTLVSRSLGIPESCAFAQSYPQARRGGLEFRGPRSLLSLLAWYPYSHCGGNSGNRDHLHI